MKVGELIELLKQFDPNLEVLAPHYYGSVIEGVHLGKHRPDPLSFVGKVLLDLESEDF